MRVTRCRSSAAPVERDCSAMVSAARPPSAMHICTRTSGQRRRWKKGEDREANLIEDLLLREEVVVLREILRKSERVRAARYDRHLHKASEREFPIK